MFTGLRTMAVAAGRGADDVALVVRANLHLAARPLGEDRGIFTGWPDQIAADIAGTRALGAAELFFDLTFSPGIATLDGLLAGMARLRALALNPATPACAS